MHRFYWILTLALAALLGVEAAAQTVEGPPPTPPEIQQPASVNRVFFQQFPGGSPAFEVLQEFRGVLNQYPPTLRDTLRNDPVRMLDADFMEPYPALAAYLEEHPEVVHNPAFFLGSAGNNDISEAVTITLLFMTVAGAIIWLVRTGIEYRRWSRASQAQAQVQAKLLDRFSGSQDLLAYLESPAGRRFLESAPILQQTGGLAPGTAMNRILWSIQAGLVLALGGWGLHYAIPRLADPGAADPLYVIGTLAIALGIGFILSAGAALALSHSLGLIRQKTTEKNETSPPAS